MDREVLSSSMLKYYEKEIDRALCSVRSCDGKDATRAICSALIYVAKSIQYLKE